jgi:hypothetical protein
VYRIGAPGDIKHVSGWLLDSMLSKNDIRRRIQVQADISEANGGEGVGEQLVQRSFAFQEPLHRAPNWCETGASLVGLGCVAE